jgi:signal transduction histidine kinase
VSSRLSALLRGPALNVAACLALLVGGLVELATLHYSSPVWLAVASCVGCTLAPLIGRSFPASSALLAVTAIATYQGLTDDPNGGFVVAATVLAFYYLGRDHPGTASIRRIAAVIGLALPAVLAASFSNLDSAANAIGTWCVLVVVPTAVGRIADRRQQLVIGLGHAAKALDLEQRQAAEVAATLERARVARELHDVVAHYVSVMVIQAGAARTVSTTEPEAGHVALEAVEAAGRRALDELRQVVGTLRHGPDDGPDRVVDLAQIHELCESIRAAGVQPTLNAADLSALSVDSRQAVYRIVQEALTNVARHAPGAHATVTILTSEDSVDVVVTDDGGRAHPAGWSLASGGHGLVGMTERVSWLGGTVEAGPRPGSGFRVAAHLPAQSALAPRHDTVPETSWPATSTSVANRLRGWTRLQPWLDPIAAVASAIGLGLDIGLRTSGASQLPSVALGLVLGALMVWRRSRPMTYFLATVAVVAALASLSGTLSTDPVLGAFTLVVPTYSVAAWLSRRRAAVAMVIWTTAAAVHAAHDHSPVGRFVGAVVAALVIFAVGRLTRAQRALRAELDARTAALIAQHDNRARVAVIEERTRIARDLHLLIAQTITAMVVQAETAKELVRFDYARAYSTVANVERSGREVLSQMRRVLGVLRADRSVPLQPSPAVDIPAPKAMAPA